MKFNEFKEMIKKVLEDVNLSTALTRALKSYKSNRTRAISKFPYTAKLAEEVRKIKEESIEDLENLLKITSENMEENGIVTHFARNSDEARKIVYELLSDCNLIVKSKSMTTEEIGLREFLESKGIEVWETDLGEFIIQILNERPMHIITPAIHIPREVIAEGISRKTRINCSEVPEIVSAVRQYLREKFHKAEAGISGANVVAADTGSLILIENEGNIRLTTGLPEKHIAIVGIEKIVPTLNDALKVAEVIWRYAGYTVPSYINIISSPSKTGDIEKVIVKGAHGPRELHVVFLDNGRLKASKDKTLKKALYCLRCGACMYECPVYQQLSGYWGEAYMGGIGVAWTAITGGDYTHLAFLCLLCGRCAEYCPMKIDNSEIIRELRSRLCSKYF